MSRPALAAPCSFPESAGACDPQRQRQHAGRGLEPSDSRESSSQETQKTRGAHDYLHPRGRRAAPSGGSFAALSLWGRGSRRARVGAAPVSSRERPADPWSDPLPAGPPPLLPPLRGGAQAGGGAPGGRGAISSPAEGSASTSLGAFPAREPHPALPWGGERRRQRREAGGGRRGTDPDQGGGGTRHRALSLSWALRSPAPRRSLHPPHAVPLRARGGAGPSPSWGGGPPRSPGAPEPRIRRGGPRRGWKRPRPRECRLRQVSALRPCATPFSALCGLLAGRGALKGPERAQSCPAPQPREPSERESEALGGNRMRAGFWSGSTLGTPVVGTLIRLLLLGFHLRPRLSGFLGPYGSSAPGPSPGCWARGGSV